jgi:hypothetical protein
MRAKVGEPMDQPEVAMQAVGSQEPSLSAEIGATEGR